MTGRRRMLRNIAILVFAPVLALAGSPSRQWQDGEILSRKTVPVGRSFLKNDYVYRLRGLNRRYVVVSKTPLQLDLLVPVKFSTFRNQIFIQGADGTEYKARIVQREVAARRR